MGFIMYGIGFSIPLLKHDLGISRAVASIHNIGFASAITVTSFVIPKLIHKYSPRDVMRAGWILTIASVLVFAIGRSLFITIPAIAVAGVAGTLFNNTNAVTVGQSVGMSIRVLLRQAGIATLSGAMAPSAIGILTRSGVSWRVTISIFAVILGTIALLILPNVPDRFSAKKVKGARHWDKSLLILVGFGFAGNSLEVTTGAWALDLLISRGAELSAAVVLVTVFTYGIGGGRIVLSFTSKLAPRKLWNYSCALVAVGLLIIIFATNMPVTMIGLVVTALGIGPIAVLAVERAMVGPKGADAGMAANVIGAGPIMGIGPWMMGWVSDRSGFSIAYCIPLFMLVVASGFYIATAQDDKSRIT